MIKEEIQTEEITIKHRYCDDCGAELKTSMACSVLRCEMCGKDLCWKCVGHEKPNSGDYREVFCKKCWEIGAPYRSKIESLEEEIERLGIKWGVMCMGNK